MTAVEWLLWPLSLIYSAAMRLRAQAYRTEICRGKHLRGIVVSVGNITVGGTGKTPMVAWVAQRFVSNGKKVAVLARGYRPMQRETGGGSGIRESVADGWNDEIAQLHARLGEQVKFGAGKNRYEKGRELEKLGVECFVLDDAFQHQQLARDVNIAMIDAANPFGGGRLLPSGRLREPISALRRADIVMIHRAEKAPAVETVIRRHSAAPIFFSQTKLLGVEPFVNAELSAVRLQHRKFFAFCGIGNPAVFLADLKRWDISIVGHRFFRDHHHYTSDEVLNLRKQASAAGAEALVCTEKDTYDLPLELPGALPIFFCKIALQFSDEEGLWRTISGIVQAKRQVAAR